MQYRETDLGFISRLMEEKGIFYYFEHSADKHLLVIADKAAAHKEIGKPTIPGAQTTIVTGPSGEEIYVDEFEKNGTRKKCKKMQKNAKKCKKMSLTPYCTSINFCRDA